MTAVKIIVPEGMLEEIKQLVRLGKYRNVADFFYIAGQKELEKVKNHREIVAEVVQ